MRESLADLDKPSRAGAMSGKRGAEVRLAKQAWLDCWSLDLPPKGGCNGEVRGSDGTVMGTLQTIAQRRDVGGHLFAASLASIPTSLSQTGPRLSQDSGLGETDPTFLSLDLSPDRFKLIGISLISLPHYTDWRRDP